MGGGITGLAAAWALTRSIPDAQITVLEGAATVGGHLRTCEVGGITVDSGAESVVASRPEAVLLAREVGLERDLVAPGNTNLCVYSRGHVRKLPRGLYLGLPTDLRALAASEVLSLTSLLRLPLDRILPATATGSDVSVGDFVAARLGPDVVANMVDPLLDGVYGGAARDLSMAATMPALFRAMKSQRSLLGATADIVSGGAAFAGARRGAAYRGIVGGVGRLPERLAEALVARGVEIRTGSAVRGLQRRAAGWQLLVGPATEPEHLAADAVILAVPAPAAARLLTEVAPGAGAALAQIEHASVAVVNLAYRNDDVPARSAAALLVPAAAGLTVKSVTFSDIKWPWIGAAARDAGLAVLRVSLGRAGQQQVLTQPDPHLLAQVRADLDVLLGIRAEPVDSRVSRWAAAMPQYHVGHRDVVREIREGLDLIPGLDIAGPAFDGVGVAACVGSAAEAARRIVSDLARMRALSG